MSGFSITLVAAGGAPAPAQASPAAPKTGNAGLASTRGAPAMTATLAVLAVTVVAGGRLAVPPRSR